MKILIAIDGSHFSGASARLVNQRSWPVGTEIRLMSVVTHKADEARYAEIRQAFDEATSILSAESSDRLIDTAIREGHVRDAILEEAESWNADLIVVGSRGQSMLETVLLGSVSQAVVSRAKCPVIVARDVQTSAFGNILVAVDDTEYSASAVEWLCTQPWANGQTIALVSTINDPQPTISSTASVTKASEALLTWETERGLLYAALEYWTNLVRQSLPAAEVHAGVIDGDARQTIVKAAEKWPAECVIMGSHGRRGLQKLVLGSVSQNVASNAPCSVEIVRGVPSQHYVKVHQLIEDLRSRSPLLNEPSHQQFGTQVTSSPTLFFW